MQKNNNLKTNNMKGLNKNMKIEFSNNRVIQDIAKAGTKKYILEIEETAKQYMLKLQHDIIEQANYDILDKTYEKSSNDLTAVYKWFINKYDEILQNLNMGLQQIINTFNQHNNNKISLADFDNTSVELFGCTSHKDIQQKLVKCPTEIIEDMFSCEPVPFEGFIKFSTFYFGILPFYIFQYTYNIKDYFLNNGTRNIQDSLDILISNLSIQVNATNMNLYEYQLNCYGQQLADFIYSSSFDLTYVEV